MTTVVRALIRTPDGPRRQDQETCGNVRFRLEGVIHSRTAAGGRWLAVLSRKWSLWGLVTMNANVLPLPTKLAAAFLAAGVVSSGALIAPDEAPLPVVSADVANASVITDALYRLGDVVNGAAYGYAITQDAGSSLPFDVATAFTVAAQNPTLAPSLLSWLVNRYANPSYDYGYPSAETGYFTYPTYFREYSLEVIAGALPFPLGPASADPGLITNAANAIAQAVGGFLGGVLPDPA